MSIFDVFMTLYIPVGTRFLNYFRKRANPESKAHRFSYLLTSLIMAATPFIYLRASDGYSALAVILVGIALFWFAIVGSRAVNT
jgi:VIT1/CCC1 family predicted Fe2+/Mn2+ transporter